MLCSSSLLSSHTSLPLPQLILLEAWAPLLEEGVFVPIAKLLQQLLRLFPTAAL